MKLVVTRPDYKHFIKKISIMIYVDNFHTLLWLGLEQVGLLIIARITLFVLGIRTFVPSGIKATIYTGKRIMSFC